MSKYTNEQLHEIIQPMTLSKYAVDYGFRNLDMIAGMFQHGLEENPDYQRGHVWTQDKQERYIEAVLRQAVPESGLVIQINDPGFQNDAPADSDLPKNAQIMDGLQRFTAVKKFMAGEIKAFGLTVDDLADTSYDPRRFQFKLRVQVFWFTKKEEVLKHYLAINSGGVVHTDEELDRVKKMLADLK